MSAKVYSEKRSASGIAKNLKNQLEELNETFWRRIGAPIETAPKKSVTIRVDPVVLNFFRSFGEGYQTRMHAVLQDFALSYPERQMADEAERAAEPAKKRRSPKKV